MSGGIATRKQRDLGSLGFVGVPAIISAAGERGSFRFVEFFTANIRNQNTRVSYGRALREFCNWCEELCSARATCRAVAGTDQFSTSITSWSKITAL